MTEGPSGAPSTRRVRTLAGIALLAVVQLAAAQTGIAFAGVSGRVALIWPPAGIALAVLLLFGMRLWPGIAIGAFAAAVLNGAVVTAAGVNALGATLAASAATLALRRVRFRSTLDRVGDVVAFSLLGAVLSPAISAVLGTSGLALAGSIPPASWGWVAWRWWLGDATGVLVVGSAVLAFASVEWRSFTPVRAAECAALFAAILALGLLVLSAQTDTPGRGRPLPYLFFPLLIAGAFRFGPAGAAGAALLIASISVGGTAHGVGPFAFDGTDDSLALLSLFIAVTSVTGLFVAAVIAERGRAESERARLASIVQATSDFVGIVDAHGRALFINDAGRALLGIADGADLATYRIDDFHTADAAAHVRDVALPAALASGIWSGETTLAHRDGHGVPVSEVIVTHRAADGTVRFVSTIARDLSERVHLEQQLIRAQKMEAVGRLAGGIAHDFNNLLTVILGQARLAQDALPERSVARAGVEEIAEAAERAATLTRQLLAFARRQRVEPRVIDLNTLVRRMERMLRRLIGADITLVTSCADGLRPVRVDPGQFEQLLANLAVNSRDAMPDGGTLRIETANVEIDAHDAARHPRQPGEHVSLTVTDTGIGMDAETLSHMFEPFFTTKEQDKGTGLGLATCYGIVTQAGGTIGAASRPGEGARFTVLLPAANGPIEGFADEPDYDSPAGRGTILLVEDEAAVRNLVRRVLEGHGYDVVVAADGEEAADLIPHIGPTLDLVITDMVMPRMGGPQLVERMRMQGCNVKVLFISGYAGEVTPPPEDVFLAKPFTPAQLAQRVREMIGG